MKKTNKYFYLRRIKDGVIVDVPERHLEQLLKTKQFEKVVDEPVEKQVHKQEKLTKQDLYANKGEKWKRQTPSGRDSSEVQRTELRSGNDTHSS